MWYWYCYQCYYYYLINNNKLGWTSLVGGCFHCSHWTEVVMVVMSCKTEFGRLSSEPGWVREPWCWLPPSLVNTKSAPASQSASPLTATGPSSPQRMQLSTLNSQLSTQNINIKGRQELGAGQGAGAMELSKTSHHHYYAKLSSHIK